MAKRNEFSVDHGRSHAHQNIPHWQVFSLLIFLHIFVFHVQCLQQQWEIRRLAKTKLLSWKCSCWVTSSARKNSDNQQHPGLTDPVSSLGTAFLMDMPGSILTKSQSTDIINYVREN